MRVQWHACGSKSEDNLWELSSSVFTCWAISLAPTFIFLKYTVKIISENIFRLPTWSDWIWLDTFFFFTICVYVHTHVCAHVLLVCLWCTLCTCSSYFSLPCWWVLGVGFRLAGLTEAVPLLLPAKPSYLPHPYLLIWVRISHSCSGWLPSHPPPVSASWIVGIEKIALWSKFCFSSCLITNSAT